MATAHHRDPRWIRPQTEYLRRHLFEPYQVFASCQGIDESWFSSFDHVVPSQGQHAGKLNLLAAEIAAVAQPDDLLMFLDGDAFPIADPMPLVRSTLERAALVAIRRDENLNQAQPHPAFCVTSVGTWRELHGDWSAGYPWSDPLGSMTDVGANLLRALERNSLPWEALVRSNTVNLHPLWFGVYGSIIYHHGAGFRMSAISRLDKAAKGYRGGPLRGLPGLGRVTTRVARGLYRRRLQRIYDRQSSEIFDAINRDPDFWHQFVR